MKPKRIMDTTDRTEAGPNQMKHGHRIDHRIIPLELLLLKEKEIPKIGNDSKRFCGIIQALLIFGCGTCCL